MKNKFLESLIRGIDVAGTVDDIKFRYALAKNRKKLMDEIVLLTEVIKPLPEFVEYDNKRVALAIKLADKDKDGKPKQENGSYVFTDQTKFDKGFKELKAENKKVLDVREKQIEEFTDLLEQESSFEPYQIKEESLPKGLSPAQISGIIDLIK